MARKRVVTDAQITRAARKVFLEHGTRAPVSWVARELGVSPATLFVRMGTKMGLINAALWPPDPPVLQRLERGFERGAAGEQQLSEIVTELAEYVDTEIPATFTLYAAGLRAKPGEDFSDVTPARLRRALTRWLRQAVRAGALACAPRTATELILGVLEARALHAFLARRAVPAREQAAFIRVLLKNVLR
ncbi:MAG TPA: TetR family transcriptional regulator [Gammaproteobacteria bacterium]|nr:TetR family transcriptional regulator [Gammaproteobacteria bacterium]